MKNPKQVARLPWRPIDGRSIIIHAKRGEVHELNCVGTFLWSHADGSKSLNDLATALASEFDGVEPDQALADTEEFFRDLEKDGLITWGS